MMSGLLFTFCMLICYQPKDGYPITTKAFDISGKWVNTNLNDLGIVRIEISENESKIQVFDNCIPKDCVWKTNKILKKSNYYEAIYESRASKRILKIYVIKEDKIGITENVIYPSKKQKVNTYELIKLK